MIFKKKTYSYMFENTERCERIFNVSEVKKRKEGKGELYNNRNYRDYFGVG